MSTATSDSDFAAALMNQAGRTTIEPRSLTIPIIAHMKRSYRDIITLEPGKRSGQPCIRGTRMTVTDVLEYLAGGMSWDELLADFPDLTREDIQACLEFAADRERRLTFSQ